MLAKQIEVGGVYHARISGNFVKVKVMGKEERFGSKKTTTVYRVLNLTTGRATTFKSAARFRGPVTI